MKDPSVPTVTAPADTFTDRLASGQVHEQIVIGQLRVRGWSAEPFGQGQLSASMRRLLQATQSPARWLPDVIAAKRFPDGKTRVAFLDPKRGRDDTDHHAVEVAALDAAEGWMEFTGCPFFFVLGDRQDVAAPDVVRATGRRGPDHGNGSGRPYLLVPRVACQSMLIFGVPTGGDR